MKKLPEIVKLQLENIELKASVLRSKFAELQGQNEIVLRELAKSEGIPFEKLAIQGDSFFNIEEQQNANPEPTRTIPKRSRKG